MLAICAEAVTVAVKEAVVDLAVTMAVKEDAAAVAKVVEPARTVNRAARFMPGWSRFGTLHP